MRTIALLLTLLAVATAPASAQITEFVAFSGSADCNGWSADATIHYWEGATMVRLEYAVVLSDVDGVEVERSKFADWISFTAGQTATMPLTGAWSSTPETGWTVRGDFLLLDIMLDAENRDEASFTATLDCGEADPGDDIDPNAPLCTHSPWWYRHHQDKWPVDEVVVAGRTLDARQAMRLLKKRRWPLLPLILVRQVVAAKLNLAANPQADMAEAIKAADAWLVDHSPFKRSRTLSWSPRRWGLEFPRVRALFQPLFSFNYHGCKDEAVNPTAAANAMVELEKAFEEAAVPVEETSFSSLKAMYR